MYETNRLWGSNMKDDREHKWYYSNRVKWGSLMIPLDRSCKNCGLRQHRHYLGGEMWKWIKIE